MGTDALRLLFTTVGLGWAVDIMEVPLINKLVDMLYDFLSANRISLGNALDGIIAAKRIDMVSSQQGYSRGSGCWWGCYMSPAVCLVSTPTVAAGVWCQQ